jgi:putative restriction endonuclease
MNLYLGVTDTDWYNYLRKANPEDVNFWQPGGHVAFRALESGAPFLFKLKYPMNAIGGVGFFVSQSHLPISLAWDTFKTGNGCDSYSVFKSAIMHYRKERGSGMPDPIIGCIVLASPVFFDEKDWIPVPADWKRNIVSGKSYSTDEEVGKDIWRRVEELLVRYHFYDREMKEGEIIVSDPDMTNRYGKYIANVRLGQGSFRLLVTDSYERRCAVTGERTLPVLEAAHQAVR